MSRDNEELRRLRDIGAIAKLESRALLYPEYRAASADEVDPSYDSVSRTLFAVTRREAEAKLDEEFEWIWDDEQQQASPPLYEEDDPRLLCDGSDLDLVAAFAERGWDVTDQEGRPLYVLPHFKLQLMSALVGKAGHLPPTGEDESTWAERMEAEAKKFKPQR